MDQIRDTARIKPPRGRIRAFVILVAFSLTPIVTLIACVKSCVIGDKFVFESNIARWQDGRQRSEFLTDLLQGNWDPLGPIFEHSKVEVDSSGGGIKFRYVNEKYDLANRTEFYDLAGGFTDAVELPENQPPTYFKYFWRAQTTYPSLGRLGDVPTWDFSKVSGGNLAVRHQSSRVIELVFPYWSVLLITSLPLLATLPRWIRRIRYRMSGRCVHCGYDLRATPDRCPECGTAVQRIRVKN
jgi:hypothetical protein